MEMKVCCVTGHRPNGFPWNYSDYACDSHQEYLGAMACYVHWFIHKHGYNYFICGGALGVDTDFAEIVIGLRDNVFNDIQLEIAVPCKGQESKWSPKDKSKYAELLQKADKVTYVLDTYAPDCMQKRNKYMVDNSDVVFAFWNESKNSGGTYNTIEYAKKHNKQLELFVLNKYL